MSALAQICGVLTLCVLSGLGIFLFGVYQTNKKAKKVCKDFYERGDR